MAVDRKKLVEKIKEMSPEDRTLFREALQEADPEAGLSMEEMYAIRKLLAGEKTKPKNKGFLETLLGG